MSGPFNKNSDEEARLYLEIVEGYRRLNEKPQVNLIEVFQRYLRKGGNPYIFCDNNDDHIFLSLIHISEPTRP